MSRVLGVSPALLFFSLSHRLPVAGAGAAAAAAAVSAAAQNILLTTLNEAILTDFIYCYGHLHAEETSCLSDKTAHMEPKWRPKGESLLIFRQKTVPRKGSACCHLNMKIHVYHGILMWSRNASNVWRYCKWLTYEFYFNQIATFKKKKKDYGPRDSFVYVVTCTGRHATRLVPDVLSAMKNRRWQWVLVFCQFINAKQAVLSYVCVSYLHVFKQMRNESTAVHLA